MAKIEFSNAYDFFSLSRLIDRYFKEEETAGAKREGSQIRSSTLSFVVPYSSGMLRRRGLGNCCCRASKLRLLRATQQQQQYLATYITAKQREIVRPSGVDILLEELGAPEVAVNLNVGTA